MARGDQRHLVHLENPGPPMPDGEGGFTESWTPLDPPTMWTSIEPASANDLQRVIGTESVIAIATHVLRMDFHPGVTIETRLNWERAPARPDRFFQVQSVINVEERDRALVLVCSEIVGATAPPQREDGSGESAPPPAGIND